MEELVNVNGQAINVGMMLMAYEEFNDEDRKSDVVKQGIYSSEENVEYGASIDIRDANFWGEIIKEGYREKMKDYLGDEFEYVEAVMDGLGEFDILKGIPHKKRIVETSKELDQEPVRVAIQKRLPRNGKERQELANGFRQLVTNTRDEYESDVVSVKNYSSAEDISVQQYKQVIGTNFINANLERTTKELLQDALHNKLHGSLNEPDNIVSRTYLNFKDEYEGMLGIRLGIEMDIKFIGVEDNENQDLLNSAIAYIENLYNGVSKALTTGILDLQGIEFDDNGDIIIGKTDVSTIKAKVFKPLPGDTMFRVEYVNDKRKNKFGKIDNVVSYKVGRDDELKEDKDDYLKYILRLS